MPDAADIAVVGAGAAGVAAALAAARKGARVALIEARDRCGGLAAHGLHRFVCGLFANDGTAPGEPLNSGIAAEFCGRLAGGDIRAKAVRRGRVWLLPFGGVEALDACARDLLGRENNLRLFLGTRVDEVLVTERRILFLRLSSGQELAVRAVVDCTGDAAVCCMAGTPTVVPGKPLLAGYGFTVTGVDDDDAELSLAVRVPYALRRAADNGQLPRWLAFTIYEPAARPGTSVFKLAVPAGTRMDDARRDAQTVWDCLKTWPAFRRAAVTSFLPFVLERESRRLSGEYVLTGEGISQGETFADDVARGSWPMEKWDVASGVSYRYPPPGGWYGIPARCLRSARGPTNLFCAGMCLSADQDAAASVRALGTCLATGEAAARLATAEL